MQKSTYTLALLCAIGALTATSVLAQAVRPLNADQVAFVKIAKQNVVRNFLDPVSAQYRNVFIAKIGEDLMLCGEVNAKNALGGYVGFRSFVGSLEQKQSRVEGDNWTLREMNMVKNMFCEVKIIDVE